MPTTRNAMGHFLRGYIGGNAIGKNLPE